MISCLGVYLSDVHFNTLHWVIFLLKHPKHIIKEEGEMVDLIKLKVLSKLCASYQRNIWESFSFIPSEVGILPATEARGRKPP